MQPDKPENVILDALGMMKHNRWKALGTLCLLPALTGCFSTTRSVMRTHPPSQVMSSTLEALVKNTTERDEAIHTLNAKVEVTASTGGGKQGKVVDYVSFSAYILLRKKNDLHFIGFLPVVGSKMLDMVTNGQTFTIVIPPKSRVITGSNDISTPSSNPLENLRPSVFTDSLLDSQCVRGRACVAHVRRSYLPAGSHPQVRGGRAGI